jgi:regulator of sirC expression with transglutaminase-like and TPR domain
MEALRTFFFETLAFTPVRGTARRDFLLPSVLERRRGYCLGLAVPYLYLARGIGLEVRAVDLPGHLFLRVRKGEEAWNVELLERGRVHSDAWYRRRYFLPDPAEEEDALRELTDRQFAAHLWNNAAYYRLRARDPRGAEEAVRRALGCWPDMPGAWLHRGLAAWMEGDARTAERHFRRALAADPKYTPAREALEDLQKDPTKFVRERKPGQRGVE